MCVCARMLKRVCCCSVTKSCPVLCDPMDCSMPVFLVSQSLLKLMSIELVMPSNHIILCRPLLLLPSIFPSIRVFYNESAVRATQVCMCVYRYMNIFTHANTQIYIHTLVNVLQAINKSEL